MLRSLLSNALRSGASAGAARSSGYGTRGRGMSRTAGRTAGRSAGYTSRGRGYGAATSGGGLGGQVARTVLGRLTRGR